MENIVYLITRVVIFKKSIKLVDTKQIERVMKI